MSRFIPCALTIALALLQLSFIPDDVHAAKPELKVGVASLAITPYGPNPEWDGQVTASGVWGEPFTDANRNGRWDAGEPFTDDDENSRIDPSSKGKYDGI